MLIAPVGQDILFSEERIEVGRNFMNKLWNASRFVLMNLGDQNISELPFPDNPEGLELADRWILSKLNKMIRSVDTFMSKFQFTHSAKVVYEFIWGDYCDWYIEQIKERLYGRNISDRMTALAIAAIVLRNILKVLHPFAPFITEEIWQKIRTDQEPDLIRAEWPEFEDTWIDENSEKQMGLIEEIVTAIRMLRSEMTVPPATRVKILVSGGTTELRDILTRYQNYILFLARGSKITIAESIPRPKSASTTVVAGFDIYIPLAELIDLKKERQRLEKEITVVRARLSKAVAKLTNPQFTQRAPVHVVDKERQKEQDYRKKLNRLKEHYDQLASS
jgi:valyl-tRNA synthetase